MPIYVLLCVECNRTEEVIVSTPDECPTHCAKCGGALKRVWSGPPALRFKGSGFYVNDKHVVSSSYGLKSSAKETKDD